MSQNGVPNLHLSEEVKAEFVKPNQKKMLERNLNRNYIQIEMLKTVPSRKSHIKQEICICNLTFICKNNLQLYVLHEVEHMLTRYDKSFLNWNVSAITRFHLASQPP